MTYERNLSRINGHEINSLSEMDRITFEYARRHGDARRAYKGARPPLVTVRVIRKTPVTLEDLERTD